MQISHITFNNQIGVIISDWMIRDHNAIDSLFFLMDETMITEDIIKLLVQEEMRKLTITTYTTHNHGALRDKVTITLSSDYGTNVITTTEFFV